MQFMGERTRGKYLCTCVKRIVISLLANDAQNWSQVLNNCTISRTIEPKKTLQVHVFCGSRTSLRTPSSTDCGGRTKNAFKKNLLLKDDVGKEHNSIHAKCGSDCLQSGGLTACEMQTHVALNH